MIHGRHGLKMLSENGPTTAMPKRKTWNHRASGSRPARASAARLRSIRRGSGSAAIVAGVGCGRLIARARPYGSRHNATPPISPAMFDVMRTWLGSSIVTCFALPPPM